MHPHYSPKPSPITPAHIRIAPLARLSDRAHYLAHRLTQSPPCADYSTLAAEYRRIRDEIDRRAIPAHVFGD